MIRKKSISSHKDNRGMPQKKIKIKRDLEEKQIFHRVKVRVLRLKNR